jgi:mRNA-degrading endonuclease RelE of RelBE toxin-antitoxin system
LKPILSAVQRHLKVKKHLLYGNKPHVYRVIYQIDERKKLVQVLTIRHGAMEAADLNG